MQSIYNYFHERGMIRNKIYANWLAKFPGINQTKLTVFIPAIEDHLHVRINVSQRYQSTKPFIDGYNFELIKGQLVPIDSEQIHAGLRTYLSAKNKQVVVVNETNPNELVCYPDDPAKFNKPIITDIKWLNEISGKQFGDDLIAGYDWYLEQMTLIHKLIGINPLQIGTLRATIQYAFENSLKTEIIPDPILDDERDWLEGATYGAYYFKHETEAEQLYCYDICSSYPATMIAKSNNFPVRRGIWDTITSGQINKYPTIGCGIYRCQVIGDPKQFKINNKGYYTHRDLELAIKNGLYIQMADDGQANALKYSCNPTLSDPTDPTSPKVKKALPGDLLFGDHVRKFYQLRRGHPECPLFKIFLSALWGSLSAARKLQSSKGGEQLYSGKEEIDRTGKVTFRQHRVNRYYYSGWARIKPFTLSYQRTDVYNRVLSKPELVKHLVEVVTDGFKFDQPIPEFDANPIGLGQICKDRKHYIVKPSKMK